MFIYENLRTQLCSPLLIAILVFGILLLVNDTGNKFTLLVIHSRKVYRLPWDIKAFTSKSQFRWRPNETFSWGYNYQLVFILHYLLQSCFVTQQILVVGIVEHYSVGSLVEFEANCSYADLFHPYKPQIDLTRFYQKLDDQTILNWRSGWISLTRLQNKSSASVRFERTATFWNLCFS